MPEGSVLIDQTTVCEASRLLDGIAARRGFFPSDEPARTAERLVHLSILLDVLMLYDHAYLLACELPSDADQLSVRTHLFERGILRTLDTTERAEAVTEEIRAFLTAATRRPAGQPPPDLGTEAMACDVVHAMLSGGHQTIFSREASVVAGALRTELASDAWPNAWERRMATDGATDPIGELARHLLSCIAYFQSGAIVNGVSHLRTFVYWRIAAHQNIPFVPSLRRLPAYALMTEHLRRTVHQRVYGVVAQSFHSAVAEVYENERPLALYLPPALSLFLGLVQDGRSPAAAIDELRAAYRPLRRSLAAAQRELGQARTLGEARAARRRLEQALERVRDHFDVPPAGVLSQVLDVAPGALRAVSNPLDVEGYADDLLRRPVSWIQNWWRSRPLRPAFTLRDRLLGLEGYDRLLRNATGIQLDPADVSALLARYESVLDIYGGEYTLPGASGTPPERQREPSPESSS